MGLFVRFFTAETSDGSNQAPDSLQTTVRPLLGSWTSPSEIGFSDASSVYNLNKHLWENRKEANMEPDKYEGRSVHPHSLPSVRQHDQTTKHKGFHHNFSRCKLILIKR